MHAVLKPAELIERRPGWWECPVRVAEIYGFDYWEEYRKRDSTEIGAKLTAARLDLVQRHIGSEDGLVDIGIGGGAFVVAARTANIAAVGHDVNPFAVNWLRHRGEIWDGASIGAMTFWDSIEHIEDPGDLLCKTKWAFISTPIYVDLDHVLSSRHYKPGEHIWYFTHQGLCNFMHQHGFELVDHNTVESDLGREGIGSYVFKRR